MKDYIAKIKLTKFSAKDAKEDGNTILSIFKIEQNKKAQFIFHDETSYIGMMRCPPWN